MRGRWRMGRLRGMASCTQLIIEWCTVGHGLMGSMRGLARWTIWSGRMEGWRSKISTQETNAGLGMRESSSEEKGKGLAQYIIAMGRSFLGVCVGVRLAGMAASTTIRTRWRVEFGTIIKWKTVNSIIEYDDIFSHFNFSSKLYINNNINNSI